MFHVVFANIFHTKIINAEREAYRMLVVFLKSRGNPSLVVVLLVK